MSGEEHFYPPNEDISAKAYVAVRRGPLVMFLLFYFFILFIFSIFLSLFTRLDRSRALAFSNLIDFYNIVENEEAANCAIMVMLQLLPHMEHVLSRPANYYTNRSSKSSK